MSVKRPYTNDQGLSLTRCSFKPANLLSTKGRGGQNKRRREVEFDLDGDVLESKVVRFGESSAPIDRQLDEARKFLLREAEKDRKKVIQFLCEWYVGYRVFGFLVAKTWCAWKQCCRITGKDVHLLDVRRSFEL